MLNQFLTFLLIICAITGLHASSVETNPQNDLEAFRIAKVKKMRKFMNESFDPCENFFEFACGNWKTYYPASYMHETTSAFEMSDKVFNYKLVQLLQTVDTMDSESELKMKDYFYACMNHEPKNSNLIEKRKRIANEFGQMPALVGDKWQENHFDWLQTLAEIKITYGIGILFSPYTRFIEQDHMAYEIIIAKENLKICSPRQSKAACERKLKTYFGLETEEAEPIASELYNFTSTLWEASQSKSTKNSENITLQELHDKYYPDLDINGYMKTIFGFIPTGEVINENPSYLDNLIEIMKKTPKNVVANYIALSLIDELFSGTDKEKTDKELCVELIKIWFPDIVSYMFYRVHNLQKRAQHVEQMWQVIKANFQMILESSALYWFDDIAREYTLEKLHSVKLMVPTYNVSYLDEKYGRLHINRSDFMESFISNLGFRSANSIATSNPIDFQLGLFSPYYKLDSNAIIVPIAALATDFFSSPMYPNTLSYSKLGFLLAHEVIHGFNGQGRQYNKLGDNVGKWKEGIENDFSERTKCLYDQYTNFTFHGKPLAQDKNQEENAADNAGILLAYQAYRKWYEDSERTDDERKMETLPNLNYTNNQLFFISYSQMFCGDTLKRLYSFLIVEEVKKHSPKEFRAFVPLINFDEFSMAFKCPKGSPMNPRKKCKIY